MKIGIIGLGLIGGSIYKDLKKHNYDVIAVSKSQDGDGIYKDYSVLKSCDVVFVCSAMNKTLAILDELETVLPQNTVVTDVCSLKGFVSKKKRPYRFIPSHPMAGTEHKGFENSFEGLFRGAKWVFTPITHDEEGLKVLTDLAKEIGAKPVITTPTKHDEAVALISHMPMVVAQALFLAAEDNPLALEIAASGFRDMTRLALSNEEMAEDMVTMNSKNIEYAILKVYKALGDLTSADYPETIKRIKSKREKMFR